MNGTGLSAPGHRTLAGFDNRPIGTVNVFNQGPLKFSGTIAGSLDPHTSFMGDIGAAGDGVGVLQNMTAVMYPMSARIFRTLRVVKRFTVLDDIDIPVTLYVNGAPSVMSVTMLAADPAGTVYVDNVHSVAVVDGDVIDMVMTSTATENALVVGATATLY